MVELRVLAEHAARLVWVAVRSFAATLFLVLAVGAVFPAGSYYLLREQPWYCGLLAVGLALVEAVVLGVVLGGKRAMAMTLAHALGSLRLGRAIIRLVFDRMLGVSEGGGRLARGLERLPLAQAEEMLTRVCGGRAEDLEGANWLRRKIQAKLLATVQKYTLARFRDDAARHGGVDVVKLRDELQETVDDVLVQRIRQAGWMGVLLVLVGLPLLVALQTWVILQFVDG